MNQLSILKENAHKEINYEIYLNIMNKLNNSLVNLNEKNYDFYSIFQRSDINTNIFVITNIIVNEKLNMICSFSDGSIMYYILDIDVKNQNNYIINKIIYKYLIKVNFLSINDLIFINNTNYNNENNYLFAVTSSEQSLKIIDPSNLIILLLINPLLIYSQIYFLINPLKKRKNLQKIFLYQKILKVVPLKF